MPPHTTDPDKTKDDRLGEVTDEQSFPSEGTVDDAKDHAKPNPTRDHITTEAPQEREITEDPEQPDHLVSRDSADGASRETANERKKGLDGQNHTSDPVHSPKYESASVRDAEDRLLAIEKALKLKSNLPPNPPPPPRPEPQLKPAIPKICVVDWNEFKGRRRSRFDDRHCCIDVMWAEPFLYYHRKTNLPEPEATSTVREFTAKEIPSVVKFADLPERIRINSDPLLEILRKVSRGTISNNLKGIVVLRPFKPFFSHLKELQDILAALEVECRQEFNDGKDEGDSKPEHSESAKESPMFQAEPSISSIQVRSDDGKMGRTQLSSAKNRPEGKAEARNQGSDIVGILDGTGTEQVKDKESESASEDERTEDAGRGLNDKYEEDPIVQKKQKKLSERNDLRCLVRLIEAFEGILEHRLGEGKGPDLEVKFHDLWHLFKPGTFFVSPNGPQTLWRVLQTTGGRPFLLTNEDEPEKTRYEPNDIKESPLAVDCYYIDFDGKEWGPSQHRFQIAPFAGWAKVGSLELYPAAFAEKGEALLSNLTARGEKFVEAMGISHMEYRGRTLTTTPAGEPLMGASHSEDTESPVIVDFDKTLQFNQDWCPDLRWKPTSPQDARETQEMTPYENKRPRCPSSGNCSRIFCCQNELMLGDFFWDLQRLRDFLDERARSMAAIKHTGNGVLQDELKLSPARVFGWVLRSRKWAAMDIDDMIPIQKDSGGFNRLQLPERHGDIVKGLVQSHFRRRELIGPTKDEDLGFDVVKAKGKGLIILLHGAPGVGKTSTAECVAEAYARPLFPITCGDLRVTPVDVEKALQLNFQLAQSWGCVLLLDEADVFLAERLKADVKRNALVSVFLRALEYYTGILFLTTNRVGTIDEAFRSRIHISLFYPILTWEQTRAIWKNNLKYMKEKRGIDVDEDDLLEYAQQLYRKQLGASKGAGGWNGRQIRNAFQTAVALAEYQSSEASPDGNSTVRPMLYRRFFDTVAQASDEFDAYLNKTHRMTASQHAAASSLRYDRYQTLQQDSAFGTHSGGHEAQNGWLPSPFTHLVSTAAGQGQYYQQPTTAPGQPAIPGTGTSGSTFVGPTPVQTGYVPGVSGFNGVPGVQQGYGQPYVGVPIQGQPHLQVPTNPPFPQGIQSPQIGGPTAQIPNTVHPSSYLMGSQPYQGISSQAANVAMQVPSAATSQAQQMEEKSAGPSQGQPIEAYNRAVPAPQEQYIGGQPTQAQGQGMPNMTAPRNPVSYSSGPSTFSQPNPQQAQR